MVQVFRNSSGQILAVSDAADGDLPDSKEWQTRPKDDPEVVLFCKRIADSPPTLEETDMSMSRVLEDVINLLIDRSLIRFTDLPIEAQVKLMDRRNTRTAMKRLRIMDDLDTDDGEVL
jgi:hypothetical protein